MVNYNPVPIMATGDWITAGWVNTYVGNNIAASWVGENPGDMDYYVSEFEKNNIALVPGGMLVGGTSAPDWFAKPAGKGLLTNDNLGAFSWLLASGNANKFLRVNAAGNGFEFVGGGISADYHSDTTAYSYSTNTWRDVPNSSKSVILAVQSTIVVIGLIERHSTDSPNGYGFANFKFNIDGTDIDWAEIFKSYDGSPVNLPIIGLKKNVLAGTRTIKIREICTAGSYESFYKKYLILVLPE